MHASGKEQSLSVLLTVLAVCCLCRSLASAHQCNYLSRPHPRGFCGSRLYFLHRNLCFLIRLGYAKHYTQRSRRNAGTSAKDVEPSARILSLLSEMSPSLPLPQVFQRLANDPDLAWKHFLYDSKAETAPLKLVSTETEEQSPEGDGDTRPQQWIGSDLTTALTGLLHDSYRGQDTTRAADVDGKMKKDASFARSGRSEGGLVCDCCYNACGIETVALYC